MDVLVFRRPVRALQLLGLGLAFAASTAAQAGNGVHPRTPVSWEPTPSCMTIVDRTVSSELVLSYTIPYEDLRPENSVDEVEDSRTHQFIALCRGNSVQEPLPVWLSTADVAKAAAVGLADPNKLTPEDILDTSSAWQDCLVRITPDDSRRLITFAAAAEPVVWDVGMLPIGAYVVNGYTWEPPFNIYSLRSGVVKIVDDPDPAASPPALSIGNKISEGVVYETETLELFGCASAMDGSTITGYWAQINTYGMPLEWVSFEADTPVVGDTFALPFAPPLEAAGNLIALKIEITDPIDRTFTAHMDILATVLEGSPPSTGGECEGSGFVADPECPGGTGGTSPTSGGESGGDSAADVTAGPDPMTSSGEGCGACAVGDASVPLGWLAIGLLMRRRSRPTRYRSAVRMNIG